MPDKVTYHFDGRLFNDDDALRWTDREVTAITVGHSDLMFKRGFLITDQAIDAADNRFIDHILRVWTKREACGLLVYHDPGVQANFFESSGVSLLMLGTAVDPLNMLGDPAEVAGRMHSLLAKSNDAFLDYLDTVGGRFVVLARAGLRRFLLQDAAGTRSAFYDFAGEATAVSSHSSLLAELLGREMTPYARDFISRDDYQAGIRHFPGNLTPYPGIAMLTPNTLLDIETRRVERFFPRAPLEENRCDQDLVMEIGSLMGTEARLLAERGGLALSLTGGIDSRATLAATHGLAQDILCYTYITEERTQSDVDVAARLCAEMGIEHEVFRVSVETAGEDLDEFMEVWRKNTSFMRAESQGRIAKVLYEKYPRDRLHLKSNISEIGRAFHRSNSKSFLPVRPVPADLALRYKTDCRSKSVIGAFARFVDLVDLKPECVFGYDMFDLLYWEHNMGSWQSLQIMDMDVAQDTFILYNNRHILKKMLSVPLADRLWNRVHMEIIRSLWPELLEIPFRTDLKPWRRRVPRKYAKKVKYAIEARMAG